MNDEVEMMEFDEREIVKTDISWICPLCDFRVDTKDYMITMASSVKHMIVYHSESLHYHPEVDE